jgi:hypothetical protein
MGEQGAELVNVKARGVKFLEMEWLKSGVWSLPGPWGWTTRNVR